MARLHTVVCIEAMESILESMESSKLMHKPKRHLKKTFDKTSNVWNKDEMVCIFQSHAYFITTPSFAEHSTLSMDRLNNRYIKSITLILRH